MKRKLLFFFIFATIANIETLRAEIIYSGTCGENLTWTLTDDGVLTISGQGRMYDYSHLYMTTPPWYSYNIKSAIIKDGVTSIGNYAFRYCRSLTSITIPNSVISIGDYAFHYCDNLTSVTIPNSVTSIGRLAFMGCSSLTSVIIGNSVTSIGEHAFYDCSSLTSVTIPNSVTSIDEETFRGCSRLTSVTIGNSVTSIGHWAFYGCSSLTTIIVESGNTIYDSRNNCNAIIETATNTLIQGCVSTIIPNSVTSIGDDAFRDCSSLTSVTIPNSVTSIGDRAFAYCSSLTSVTIPNSVTSIGRYAFYKCSRLYSIYNYAKVPQSIDPDVFEEVNKNTCVLCVPKESVEAYEIAPIWQNFYKIIGVDVPEDTAIDDVFSSNTTEKTQKVLIDGNIYLLTPDGRKLNMQGAEVK